jgi:hypothetical protein
VRSGVAWRMRRHRVLVHALLGLLACCWGGCASTVTALDTTLLADAAFQPPVGRADAADLLDMSPAMHQFLDRTVRPRVHRQGAAQALMWALSHPAGLQLAYDARETRNAAQTFEARAGNCLSLLLMAASLARELGLTVQFRRALGEDDQAHLGGMVLHYGHVNLLLGHGRFLPGSAERGTDLVVDFVPPEQAARVRVELIDEGLVRAMFLNNRAVESLMQGQLDQAYWWARAALLEQPGFGPAYNTLGVIYQRHGQPALARRAFSHLLALQPQHAPARANLALLEAGTLPALPAASAAALAWSDKWPALQKTVQP